MRVFKTVVESKVKEVNKKSRKKYAVIFKENTIHIFGKMGKSCPVYYFGAMNMAEAMDFLNNA